MTQMPIIRASAHKSTRRKRMEQEYQDITRPREVREEMKKLRKKFLRYQEAEVVYSISHRKLIGLADRAGALYRMEGTVLINRDIFDAYLENFHEKTRGIGKRGLSKVERKRKEEKN
jgi:microsomal dipeptidase-like Zn-dependent dipeptidase